MHYFESPAEEFLGNLLQHCQEGRSGTLFFVTKDENWGKFVLEQGKIASVRYKTVRDKDALPLIRALKNFRWSFHSSEKAVTRSDEVKDRLTREVFGYFGLELHVDVKPHEAIPSSEEAAERHFSAQPPKLPKKVLVVDDSLIARKATCKPLVQAGYYVVEASDGFEALGQMQNENPDLLVLDLIMPGIDGYKVIDIIKKNSQFDAVPIIILTSRDSLLDKLKGKLSDSDEYLTKPFKPEALLEKVAKYLK